MHLLQFKMLLCFLRTVYELWLIFDSTDTKHLIKGLNNDRNAHNETTKRNCDVCHRTALKVLCYVKNTSLFCDVSACSVNYTLWYTIVFATEVSECFTKSSIRACKHDVNLKLDLNIHIFRRDRGCWLSEICAYNTNTYISVICMTFLTVYKEYSTLLLWCEY